MATTDEHSIDDPIAVRRLSIADDPNRIVTLTIGKPHPDPKGDWACQFRVDGVDGARGSAGHGIDALQALLIAIEGVRSMLDASGLHLSWEGGEPGDAGIPRMVPMFYGRTFAEKVERHIDQEIHAFGDVAKRAHDNRRGQADPDDPDSE